MEIKYKILFFVLVLISFDCKADTLDVPLQFPSIQLALDTADSNDIIIVQPGIYIENLVWPTTSGIQLLSAGDTSNTFIDGGNISRVITLNDYSNIIDSSTIINGFTIQNGYLPDSVYFRGVGINILNCSPTLLNLNIRNNKSLRVSYGVGISINNSNSIIENVTISYCEIINPNKVYGMGIYCDSSHITINNLTISNLILNSAEGCYGAGIYSRNSHINLSNYSFKNNHLIVDNCYGGAINSKFDKIILHNFEISNNSFNSLYNNGNVLGGGIHYERTNGEIFSGAITNNHFNNNDSSGYCYGGGIYIDDSCNVTINNIMVNENYINSYNSVYGGGAYISDFSVVEIDSSSFNTNTLYGKTWTSGGGIHVTDNSNVKINHSYISGNVLADSLSSSKHGGGISISYNSILKILNTCISNNYCTYGALWYSGGGIYATSSQISLINSIVSNNLFGLCGNWYYGGGIYARDESYISVANSTITGNIKLDSTAIKGSGVCVDISHLDMINSICINKNSSSNNEIWTSGIPIGTRSISYSNTRGICPGPGNIDSDPLFVSDIDYHIQVLSPCKNTGNSDTTGLNIPLVDIDGNPRIYEEIIDMGAYENQEQSVSIYFPENEEIIVFPNPTDNIFYITGIDVLNVLVLNEFGQVIIEKRKKSRINLGSYANGIYLIKITTEHQVILRKIIKQ